MCHSSLEKNLMMATEILKVKNNMSLEVISYGHFIKYFRKAIWFTKYKYIVNIYKI